MVFYKQQLQEKLSILVRTDKILIYITKIDLSTVNDININ